MNRYTRRALVLTTVKATVSCVVCSKDSPTYFLQSAVDNAIPGRSQRLPPARVNRSEGNDVAYECGGYSVKNVLTEGNQKYTGPSNAVLDDHKYNSQLCDLSFSKMVNDRKIHRTALRLLIYKGLESKANYKGSV
jgi:hypothetical protein